MSERPYDGLDPSTVLRALDALGWRGDGRIMQLNSYENRVFQVHLEDGQVVVAKFYRPHRWSNAQIVEEHEFALELARADVQVVAPQSHHTQADAHVECVGPSGTLGVVSIDGRTHRVGVARRCAGRTANLEDTHVLRWIGRYVGRLHAVGLKGLFAHRRSMDIVVDARQARDTLVTWPANDERGLDAFVRVCDDAIAALERLVEAVGPVHATRLHGDFHPGNLLWRDEASATDAAGPHFVDLDDACTGPAVQDLWMLVSGDEASQHRQHDALMDGYRLFCDFDAKQWRLVEPLRTLRMMRHSAWIAQRWRDPAFPAAFPWFDAGGYWQQQATQLREQLSVMHQA